MKISAKKLHLIVTCLIGACVVVGLLLFARVNKGGIQHELAALYLVPQPERLTELYFNNNTQLPDVVSKDQTVNFVFVIHNLEKSDYQYVYRVEVYEQGVGHIIDQESVMLKDGAYFTRQESFKLADTDRNQEVIVELVNKQQYINFWIGKR